MEFTDASQLAQFIDHTVLYADTTRETVARFCREAVQYGFAAVCFNPGHVRQAAGLLEGTPVKVCTVIGFPLGATTSAVKAFEAREAVENGAAEVDMVIDIGALKEGDLDQVLGDIRAVVNAVAGRAAVKTIIETCLLTDDEKATACLLAKKGGAAFVKTSSGFSRSGATVEDVALMKRTVGPHMGVKASTGVRTAEAVLAMVRAGATRIGTGSGIAIVTAGKLPEAAGESGTAVEGAP